MADDFDITAGPHPSTLSKPIQAYSITVIGNHPLRAVLTVAAKDGTRSDITLTQEDAFQIALTLAAFGDLQETDPRIRHYEEMAPELPFRSN